MTATVANRGNIIGLEGVGFATVIVISVVPDSVLVVELSWIIFVLVDLLPQLM